MGTRKASYVAGLFAAGALLAGCGGDPGSAASGQMVAPSSEQAAPSGSTEPAQEDAGQGDGAQEGGGSGQAAADRCTAGDLSATVDQPLGGGAQQRSSLVWRNTSDQPCTMTGFGGVDLRGPADPTFGPSYSLPRSSQEPTTITIKPGGTGISTITTMSGGDWTPTEVVVTAPDETTSTTVPWRGGPVQRQDGATRPGSFIGPVEQGSL